MTSDIEATQSINDLLGRLKDPETGRGLSKQIKSIEVSDKRIHVQIGLTSFAAPLKSDFQNQIEFLVKERFPDYRIEVEIVNHERALIPLGTVGLTAKAAIAVAAGKGGVGKSTVSVGLALALHRAGCKVGLLDADVYGPSIPQLTGVRGQIARENEKLVPLDYDGIPLMSIGFIVPPGEAVIWRGPMLHKYTEMFLGHTAWGDLDYLIIDMPPGTGDVALSLSQMLPLTGAVIVCTPQEVALIDAIKAVGMFRKVKIPILGMVENMSSFICPDTGKRYDIFGKGGAREYANQDRIPFLGEIPTNINLRERGDAGAMAANLDDPNVGPYLQSIAYQLVKNLSEDAAKKPFAPQLPVLG
jgi:ATP-binding protein involved in chromosome partitioning